MLTPPRVTPGSQRGFSLVELAIGLLVVAILLGALLPPLASQVEQQRYRQTEQALEEIREALYGFAMANGRLPRPARTEIDGRETEACPAAPGCSGFVPYVTLGVSRGDAHGKLFMYSVTTRFTETEPRLTFADAGAWTVQTRLATDPARLVPLAQNVVAVVRSFGARNFGRSIHGSDIANSATGNGDELFNSGTGAGVTALGSLTFRHRMPSTREDPAHGGAFDDQMTWIATSLYMRRMVEAGRVP